MTVESLRVELKATAPSILPKGDEDAAEQEDSGEDEGAQGTVVQEGVHRDGPGLPASSRQDAEQDGHVPLVQAQIRGWGDDGVGELRRQGRQQDAVSVVRGGTLGFWGG